MSMRLYSMYDGTYGSSVRTMYQSNQEYRQNVEKLSTGKQINSSADNIAGLSLAANIEKVSSGSNIVQINAQTGINMLETAEDNLAGMIDSLHRIRDLSVQAANSVYSDNERDMLQQEVEGLVEGINQTYNSAKFGDKKLFDNEGDPLKNTNLQIGVNTDNTSQMNISTYFDLGAMNFSVTTVALARNTIDLVDSKLDFVNDIRSNFGSQSNKLKAIIDWQKNQQVDYSQAHSTIMDTDMAKTKTKEVEAQIKGQFATTVFQQAKGMSTGLIMQMYNGI